MVLLMRVATAVGQLGRAVRYCRVMRRSENTILCVCMYVCMCVWVCVCMCVCVFVFNWDIFMLACYRIFPSIKQEI